MMVGNKLKVGFPLIVSAFILLILYVFLETTKTVIAGDGVAQNLVVVGTWQGDDRTKFESVLTEFTNQTGILTTYDQTNNIWARLLNCSGTSTCPDVAQIPIGNNTELIGQLAANGDIIPIESVVTEYDLYYSQVWRTLSSVGGTLYGIPIKAGTKSLIWYRPDAFAAINATVPSSWAELLALSDQLVQNGQTPFSIGAESGGASGWPISDWFENILIRVAGTGVHRTLVRHDMSWTDPIVVETLEKFSDIVGQDDYQVGGRTGTINTNFLDALFAVFGPSPSGTMYSASYWIRDVISDTLVPGTDYGVFVFPEIQGTYGTPHMGGADFVVMFHQNNEVEMLMQFLASPTAAEVWAAKDDYLSPNGGVNLNTYPDVVMQSIAQELINASDFVFDLDDQLPAEVQLCMWTAMLDYLSSPEQVLPVLQELEDCATIYQGLPYHLFLPLAQKE